METIDQARLDELETREQELGRRADAAGARASSLRAQLDQLTAERHAAYTSGEFDEAGRVAEQHAVLSAEHRVAEDEASAIRAAQAAVAGQRQHTHNHLRAAELKAARDEHDAAARESLTAALKSFDQVREHLGEAQQREAARNAAAAELHGVRHAIAERDDPATPHTRFIPSRVVDSTINSTPLLQAINNGNMHTGVGGPGPAV